MEGMYTFAGRLRGKINYGEEGLRWLVKLVETRITKANLPAQSSCLAQQQNTTTPASKKRENHSNTRDHQNHTIKRTTAVSQ